MSNNRFVTSTTTLSPQPEDSTNLWLYIGIGLLIVLLVIGGFLIYWFLMRKPSTPITHTCTGQTCSTGQYCNSAGQCLSGTGEISGNPCSKNSDCLYGNHCISDYCLSTSSIGITSLPPQFNLTFSYGGQIYYFNPGQSSLIKGIPPTTTLSYDSVNQILFINGTNNSSMVNVQNNGTLATATKGYPLTLTGITTSIQIQHPCGSILSYSIPKDPNSNIPIFFPIGTNDVCPATFQNIAGSIPLNLTVQPVSS
jgi:hypothetical protein